MAVLRKLRAAVQYARDRAKCSCARLQMWRGWSLAVMVTRRTQQASERGETWWRWRMASRASAPLYDEPCVRPLYARVACARCGCRLYAEHVCMDG